MSIVCKNCQLAFEGKYCPECGQKASTKRFSTKILFKEFLDKFLPLDRGVLFTSWELIRRPGEMLRGYLAGKRVGYTKPFQYLLIIIAVSLIFFPAEEFQKGLSDGMSNGDTVKKPEVLAFQQQMAQFFTSHMSVIILGMIPFLALVSRWFYRKEEVNYAEQFVMNSYLLAGCSVLSMPFAGLSRLMDANIFSSQLTFVYIIIYIGYYIWAHLGFYKGRNIMWIVVKATLSFLLAYLLYILFVGIGGVLVAAVYFSVFK
jgi:hypothetical protein